MMKFTWHRQIEVAKCQQGWRDILKIQCSELWQLLLDFLENLCTSFSNNDERLLLAAYCIIDVPSLVQFTGLAVNAVSTAGLACFSQFLTEDLCERRLSSSCGSLR